MDGRQAVWVFCGLLAGAGGCVGTGAQKHTAGTVLPGALTTAANPVKITASSPLPPSTPSANKKEAAAPKRTPLPVTVIALANMKEREADLLKAEPERQFKARDEARQLYQEALKLDGNCLDAHRGLGRIYVHQGDYSRALDVYQKAIVKLPKEPVLWHDLAMLHNRQKNFDEGIKCLNKAVESDPENRQVLQTLGFTLARAGHVDQGFAMLVRAMGSASAHYNIGRMLIHLNRPEEGRQHLRQAVDENPNLEGAHELLARMDAPAAAATVQLEMANP